MNVYVLIPYVCHLLYYYNKRGLHLCVCQKMKYHDAVKQTQTSQLTANDNLCI